jgi:hypothetical protein
MRSSMAYFAGAGTVVVAVVAGLGGGLLFANMISAKAPKVEQTRLERRMSSEPIQVSNAPTEPVPYLATPQPSAPGATAAVVPVQAQPQQAPPQTETTNSASAAAVQAKDNSAATQKADTSSSTRKEASTTPTPPATPLVRESVAAADVAVAKARDGDLKRGIEKRKAERRQQWTERRRRQPRQELGQDQEPREVEVNVREETGPRREFIADPVRVEMPRIQLFGPE